MLMACLNGDGCVAKMELKQYVVDAFTQQLFAGNPAAVVVLDAFLDADLMQKNRGGKQFVRNGICGAAKWCLPNTLVFAAH